MEITSNKFLARFEPDENKIILALMEDGIGEVIVNIKDRDSNTCMFKFNLVAENSGSEWWVVPLPKNFFDFQNDRNFSGFTLEIYRKSDMKIIQTLSIDLGKGRLMKKRIEAPGPINLDPIFINYTQFFVDGIYNQFFAGARIKTAIDIGANVGLFTEWVLDRFGSDTKVVSVEPSREACESFNSMHYSKKNVFLERLALTSKDGETIRLLVNPQTTTVSMIEGAGNGVTNSSEYSEYEYVGTISLNGLLAKHSMDGADLLKVDIEGAEYDAFSVVTKEDLKKFKHLLIEFHDNKGRVPELVAKIESAGFEVDIRADDTRYKTDTQSDRGTIFATRK
jgi:FkbM family methyltransferase